MNKSILKRLNSFIINAGGYKGFLFINIAILLLVLALVFLQQNWIKEERRAIESVIDRKSVLKRTTGTNSLKESEKQLVENSSTKNHIDVSANILLSEKETSLNIEKMIKEADMYFEYEQYEKALRIYELLTDKNYFLDEEDKVYSRIAECYYNLDDFKKSLEAYRKVYKDFLDSHYRLSAQLGMGKCLILIGNYDESRRVLYSIAGQEAKYKQTADEINVIEAYYKIADSYIEHAKAHLK
ncbi:MAG: tol-pal system YbgF family protein [Candidatus Scalinduaceae bacterium]